MNELASHLEKIATALEANASIFEQLDSVAGDGDLGITAGKIATGIRLGISEMTDDLKADLTLLGRSIAKTAPSTFGTLVATGFLRASAAISTELNSTENLVTGLTAAYEGIALRGKSQLGERTLLDALHPAIESLKCATTLDVGLHSAAIAARKGAKETAAMAPKHGRAGWIGDRASGNEDAGATVIAVVFESLV
jgi:hypothetical protein